MLRSPWLLAMLFAISVLPATVIALLLAAIGLPFWVAGVADALLGNIPQSTARPDIQLLFISPPLGIVGIYCLWRVFWLLFRHKAISNPGRLALGLLSGILAGMHLLFLKIPLLVLVLPGTVFALLHLREAYRHAHTSDA